MARKTKQTKRGNSAVTLCATLERFVREGRRQQRHEELHGLEHLYARNENPLAAWHAYHLCRRHALPLPAWVLAYMDSVADKLIGIEPKSTRSVKKYDEQKKLRRIQDVKSVASAVARAVGLVRHTRRNLYDKFYDELRAMYRFIEIRRELNENGRKYGSLKPLFAYYAEEHGMTRRAVRDQYHIWLRRYGDRRVGAPPFLVE
jgi:hypothetical protein